jgi:diguanylate cyclase (GGDEF)-like protein
LPDTDGAGALIVAERIRRAVECLGIPHEANSPAIVTISAGVAARQAGPDGDPAMLVGAADRALYAAKQQGRNRICVADVDEQEPTELDLRVKRS